MMDLEENIALRLHNNIADYAYNKGYGSHIVNNQKYKVL